MLSAVAIHKRGTFPMLLPLSIAMERGSGVRFPRRLTPAPWAATLRAGR
jgi:hypothetical protein